MRYVNSIIPSSDLLNMSQYMTTFKCIHYVDICDGILVLICDIINRINIFNNEYLFIVCSNDMIDIFRDKLKYVLSHYKIEYVEDSAFNFLNNSSLTICSTIPDLYYNFVDHIYTLDTLSTDIFSNSSMYIYENSISAAISPDADTTLFEYYNFDEYIIE